MTSLSFLPCVGLLTVRQGERRDFIGQVHPLHWLDAWLETQDAILGSIVTAVYRNMMASSVPSGVPSTGADIARDTLGGAAAVAAGLPGETGAALLAAARQAFTEAVVLTAAVSTVLVIAAAIVTAMVFRDVRSAA